MTQSYPLFWPIGWPRTKGPTRSRFTVTVSHAVANVMDELRRFGTDSGRKVENLVISSNVTLTSPKPADPGVAAYFRWDNSDCCLAVDRYLTPAENLQAIYKVVAAERTKMRHGGINIVRAAFRGYTALPPPMGADGQIAAPWWSVLGFSDRSAATIDEAETRYRDLVKRHHPDAGGDAGRFAAIADAIREARTEFGR